MEFTVAEVVDAIELNGYKKARSTMIRYAEADYLDFQHATEIVSACALGQGALNLGVDPDSLGMALGSVLINDHRSLYSEIVRCNDSTGMLPRQIAHHLRSNSMWPKIANTKVKAKKVNYKRLKGYLGVRVGKASV